MTGHSSGDDTAVTPLKHDFRNPAGVIQSNIRDHAPSFSDQPDSPKQVRSAWIGNARPLGEQYHSVASFQGARDQPERHG